MRNSVIIQVLRMAFHAYLELDVNTLHRLQALGEKIIELHIEDWHFNCFLLITPFGIDVTQFSEQADASIHAESHQLFRMGVAKICQKPLPSQKITFSGDYQLGEKIYEIFNKMDIDWEEQLAKLIGNTSAYHVNRGFNTIFSHTQQFVQECQHNIRIFLQAETKQLPSKEEVENFIHEIIQLRLDVERLEARFKRLESSRIE